VDIDGGLDKVFKKSMSSIIRNATRVQVKDSSIRDSTNLLGGLSDNS